MYQFEWQVEFHHQQLRDEMRRAKLARLSIPAVPRLYALMKSAAAHALVSWNARFKKDIALAVEACCAVVAPVEAECADCAATA